MPVRDISRRLADAGIVHALGGSGLMRLLGIEVPVRDWDLTTDAGRADIEQALDGFAGQSLPPAAPCRSDFLLSYAVDGETIEIMGRFRLETPAGQVAVRTRVTDRKHGIPLGCPAEWARAYRLMGRDAKAELLEALLRGN
ncbi:MAG: hypothetical protein R3233_09310 [Xanthomonadales bacterium]|nr:hypothetical protein [Xanthomonadales bacterium]